MRADNQTQSEVAATIHGMFEAYKKRDLNGVLAFWAPDSDVCLIGSGADEKSVGVNAFAKMLFRDWAQSDSASVELSDVAVSAAGVIAWFSADIVVHGKVNQDNFDYPGRLTGVTERRNGNWLLLQMHFSVPNNAQENGHSWPKLQPTK